MMVTDISAASKSRSRVFIDDEFAFVLYKGELRHYGIEIGGELSEADYDEICAKLLPRRAKMRALHLLKDRRYTVIEMQKKLQQCGYAPAVIEMVLEYLQSYGYVDDEQYARDYVACHIGTRSHRYIRESLRAKGIPCEITDVIYSEATGGGEEAEELEERQIRRLLEKKKYDPATADIKERQRLFASLCRRGYRPEHVRRCLAG